MPFSRASSSVVLKGFPILRLTDKRERARSARNGFAQVITRGESRFATKNAAPLPAPEAPPPPHFLDLFILKELWAWFLDLHIPKNIRARGQANRIPSGWRLQT